MISNELFKIKEFPKFIPESSKHIDFWRMIKRHCIEGMWQGGKWMPGITFQFVNVWHIGLKESVTSKSEIIAKPFLRDLEWEKGYIFAEARGFSGFSLDENYSCNIKLKEVLTDKHGVSLTKAEDLTHDCYKKDGSLKQFIPAREYLRKIHSGNLGKPLYENQSYNVIDIESRGGGKSYWGANMIAHNFLFDGAVDYDEYLERKKSGIKTFKSETLVGASDYKYTADLIKKYWLGIDNLPGTIEYNGKKYGSPLFLEYTGSLSQGSSITAQREVKIGNNWQTKGSKSMVHNRSFGDNEFTASGTRSNLVILEEVGFMSNLIGALGTIKDAQMNGDFKMGTTWMYGTGGDMEGGATLAAQEVFYAPEDYDCLVFDDEYEDKGKIGYFIPAHMTLNDCRDSEGIIDKPKAKAKIQAERDKKKNNARAYIKLLENRPEKHSEAFMTSDHNMFPVKDLTDRLAALEINNKVTQSTWNGWLSISEEGQMIYKLTDDIPANIYPTKKNINKKGCIEIYQHPLKDTPPRGMYIAGIDTYDDDASTTDSYGSIFILNTLTDQIVAEYTGRPDTAKEFYEICRRLIIYYNAPCNYENNKKGLYAYFETKNQTYLLCDTPQILKDVENITIYESGNKSKGTNASETTNKFARSLLRTWLMKTEDEEITKIQKIRSLGLLRELIAYHPRGNFDRISALGMVMILRENNIKVIVDELTEDSTPKDDFFSRNWNNPNVNKSYNGGINNYYPQ